MSCEFYTESIRIPALKLAQAEALLKKHDLETELIFDGDGNQDITLNEFSMPYSTASEITDDLFPELAELLKDTPEDGQLIETECEGDKTTYFLFDGKAKEIPGDLVIMEPGFESFRTSPPVKTGEERDVFIHVKVLGLPGDKAVVLEYNVR
jgi:hypothetical protein